MSIYKLSYNNGTIHFNNMMATQPSVNLSLSKWTIDTPLTIGINGNILTNYGRGGWVELAYIPFTVEANGTYSITYDYFIENATCGSHGTYGFGLWITENTPDKSSSFYNDSSNRNGTNILSQNETVSNKSGSVSFNIELLTGKTYYLWFPGGSLNDNSPFRFTFKNIRCNPVSTDYVPTQEEGNLSFTPYIRPSGTYYTTLYQGSPSAAVSGGYLSDNILNYDVIKVYGMPGIYNANDASGSQIYSWMYPVSWLSAGNGVHLQPVGVIANTYMSWSDSLVKFPSNNSFTQAKFGNAFRATTTASTSATWNYGNSASYTNLLRTINKIEGVKYSGTRELLFTSTNGASAGTLSKGGSNYDMLQFEVALSSHSTTDGRYILEMKKYGSGTGRNTLSFPFGGGGNWYRSDAMLRWTDDTHFTIPSAKALLKSTTTTAGITVNTGYNNKSRNCVFSIWGIKW